MLLDILITSISITKNRTFGDIVSTVGKILSLLYISSGEDKINLFWDNEKKKHKGDKMRYFNNCNRYGTFM